MKLGLITGEFHPKIALLYMEGYTPVQKIKVDLDREIYYSWQRKSLIYKSILNYGQGFSYFYLGFFYLPFKRFTIFK